MDIKKAIKKSGLKMTESRSKILTLLSKTDQHMTAEDIYKHFATSEKPANFSTIYRTLQQFVENNIIIKHYFESQPQAYYEIAPADHHDHLLCLDCGRVIEFVDQIIEQRQIDIATEHGFVIDSHTLHLQGRCQTNQCQYKNVTQD